MANLAHDPEGEEQLLEAGVLESLAGLVHSPETAVLFHTARALEYLTKNSENREYVVDTVGMGPFIALCQAPELRVKKMAAKALGNLGVHVELQVEEQADSDEEP